MRKITFAETISIFLIFLAVISGTGCSGSAEKDETAGSVTQASPAGETTAAKTEITEPIETGISSETSADETFMELTGPFLPDQVFDLAVAFSGKQLAYTESVFDHDRFPYSTYKDGEWDPATSVGIEFEQEWFEGFLPGCLWYMYELTGDEKWKENAASRTASLEWQKHNTQTSDIGYKLISSFGSGFRLLSDENYKGVIISGAGSLASRYNYYVNAIKCGSWYHWRESPGAFTLFCDDIMNTELLFLNGYFGKSVYTAMALNHCLTSYRGLVREDGSSWHLAEYDDKTGQMRRRYTYQGENDDSVWSRGQAWLIYGFTMAYRYTRDPRMLEYAKKVSGYWIANIPDDHVPYWDFRASAIPDAEKDSSAAAIAASAFLELSTFCEEESEKTIYFDTAVRTIYSLSSPSYLAQGTGCRAILLHGAGFYPAGKDVDAGLIFGDYYYLEALARYKEILGSGTLQVLHD